MSSNDGLGDRIKFYEQRYTTQTFMPLAPVVARMDGRAFHTFTRGMKRPFCERLSSLMRETTRYLVQETNARCGYTQSDEITLVWLSEDWETDIFFCGKLQKMNSVLASMTTAFFNKKLPEFLPEKSEEMPLFDCRVFQVPTSFEATNCFIWREKDATRNSVQMAARAYYSHEECMNKNSSELNEMLFKKGINWNDYPAFFKRGTYFRRRNIDRPLTVEELDQLPLKHNARTDPNFKVTRTSVMAEEFPPLTKIVNRDDVIFHGAEVIE